MKAMDTTVLDQQVDQASFLWRLRRSAVYAPHYDLPDLARLDLRVEAHLDGLRISGDHGWQLCRNELARKESGAFFAAATLAFESCMDERIAEVLALGTASPQPSKGIVSALGWMSYPQAAPHIQNLFGSKSPPLRSFGIAAAAIHRKDPGQPLQLAASDPDPVLRARSTRAIGELRRVDLAPLIQIDLKSKDEGCRFWSAWATTLLLGYMDSVRVLQSFAESASPYRDQAVQLAIRRLDIRRAHDWNLLLSKNPRSVRTAVIGAGVIGDPVLIPWLIEQMTVPRLSRVAGEAFTMITGVDLAYQDLDGKRPEGFESGPNNDPSDENVEMDQDERLPWPNAELIISWWDKHGNEFQDGVRYLLGKPIREEWMWEVLRVGRQRQRAAAALELAIMRPGEPLFEVRTPGFRQLEMLRRLPAS
jgi:uncharacterized protein (TIGR02270 family)